jgi:hypothetical protein
MLKMILHNEVPEALISVLYSKYLIQSCVYQNEVNSKLKFGILQGKQTVYSWYHCLFVVLDGNCKQFVYRVKY